MHTFWNDDIKSTCMRDIDDITLRIVNHAAGDRRMLKIFRGDIADAFSLTASLKCKDL